MVKCSKYCWIDGTFFQVIPEKYDADKGRVSARCVSCDHIIQGVYNVSSNFTTHLKRKHPDKVPEYENHKKFKRDTTNATIKERRVTCLFSQKQFEDNVVNLILENQLPAHIVEKPGFRKIFDDMKIGTGRVTVFKHISRHTVGKRINEVYDKTMKDIRMALSRAKWICTTADCWSSRNRRFLGVTAHWIDETTLERKSAALACRRFPGTHSFDRIAELMTEIHSSFDLNRENIVATVTDNGSNFVKAFKEFGLNDQECFLTENAAVTSTSNSSRTNSPTSLQGRMSSENVDGSLEDNFDEISVDSDNESDCSNESEFDENGADIEEFLVVPDLNVELSLHFRCASHTLNLLATTDLKKIISDNVEVEEMHETAISRCQEIWKCLQSPKKKEALREYLKVCLKRPVATRWNSLYDCIYQLYSLKDKLTGHEIQQILDLEEPLHSGDFDYLQEYLLWAKPLAEATDKLQAEKECYYGYLLPTLVGLKRKFYSLLTNNRIRWSKAVIRGLIEALEHRFSDYFNIEDCGEFAAAAAILHPRFKMSWVQCLSTDCQVKMRTLVKNLLEDDNQTSNRTEEVEEEKDEFFHFGGRIDDLLSNTSLVPQSERENEITRYLQDRSMKLSILDNYPRVKEAFFRYNTPLPSSAPVERLFSHATLMDTPKFNRLTDTNFEKRVLCKANIRKYYI